MRCLIKYLDVIPASYISTQYVVMTSLGPDPPKSTTSCVQMGPGPLGMAWRGIKVWRTRGNR
eukprot:8472135-Heterocapsa_arctica.AAC.1